MLEIEVQGARQVRAAMPEAVLVFIAPPDPAALRERLEGRGTDTAEAIPSACAPPRSSSTPSRSSSTWSSTTTSSARPRSWSGSCAPSSALASDARDRHYTPAPMIKPRVDKLLERTDTHYAAVLVAAKRARQLNSYYRALGEGSYEEYTPPMVETADGQLPDDRARRARPGQDQVRVPRLAGRRSQAAPVTSARRTISPWPGSCSG